MTLSLIHAHAALRRNKTMDPQVGQLINNKYRLVRLIGDGGMGSVFEARHELLGTTVALKFLHAMLARRKGLVDRFLQEAQVSARIKSPHVVTVSDVDRTPEGLAFMVMEYVEGDTLQTIYEKNYQASKRLSYAEAFDYMLQILDGVSAAHALGIVHRDLKPDNIILSSVERKRDSESTLVKVLDFGIAKLKASGEVDRGLTRPGVVMGTPEYMAPEQAFSADRVDGRADIFSLGVMFFEMLAGRRPVGGDNAHAIAAQYLEGQIAQLRELVPSIAPELAAAVHQAMAAQPEDRFDTVAAFRRAIGPFAPDGSKAALADTYDAESEGMPPTVPPDRLYGILTAGSAGASPAGANGVGVSGGGASSRISEHDSERVAEAFTSDGDEGEGLDAEDPPNTHAARVAANALRGGTEGVIEGGGTAQMEGVQADALRAGTAPMTDRVPRAQGQYRDPDASGPVPPTAPAVQAGRTMVGDDYVPFDRGYSTPDGVAAPAQPTAQRPVVPARRPKKSGSILSVLGIAALVSGVVMGGVYVAHEASQNTTRGDERPASDLTSDDGGDEVVTPAPEPEPAPPEPTMSELPPAPVPQPPVSQPPPRPQPQPRPTPKPQPPPPPPLIPTLPTVIPSQLPFPFPALPGLQPPSQPQPVPQPQPTLQPPQPQPPPPPPPPPPKYKIPFPKIKVQKK